MHAGQLSACTPFTLKPKKNTHSRMQQKVSAFQSQYRQSNENLSRCLRIAAVLYRNLYVLVSLNGAVRGGQHMTTNKPCHCRCSNYACDDIKIWQSEFPHGKVNFHAWEEAQTASCGFSDYLNHSGFQKSLKCHLWDSRSKQAGNHIFCLLFQSVFVKILLVF